MSILAKMGDWQVKAQLWAEAGQGEGGMPPGPALGVGKCCSPGRGAPHKAAPCSESCQIAEETAQDVRSTGGRGESQAGGAGSGLPRGCTRLCLGFPQPRAALPGETPGALEEEPRWALKSQRGGSVLPSCLRACVCVPVCSPTRWEGRGH